MYIITVEIKPRLLYLSFWYELPTRFDEDLKAENNTKKPNKDIGFGLIHLKTGGFEYPANLGFRRIVTKTCGAFASSFIIDPKFQQKSVELSAKNGL